MKAALHYKLLDYVFILYSALFCFIAVRVAAVTEILGKVDDALGRPVANAVVQLSGAGTPTIFDEGRTNSRGSFSFAVSSPGTIKIVVKCLGFAEAQRFVQIGLLVTRINVQLTLQADHALTLSLADRQNQPRNALSTGGANAYRFDQAAIHELPAGFNTPLSQVLDQAPGVSPDSYAQGQSDIHIHGENGGGIQYRLDGIFLPDAVSEFGEIFSPRFTRSVTLLTGVLPAEMGYRTEGVVDIRTENGCGDGGRANNNVEFWGGQHATIEPSFEYGGCAGNLSYYFSGFYLQNSLGLQSPSASPTPNHDNTRQGQVFGALSFTAGPYARISLLTGVAQNYFQIPPTPGLSPAYSLQDVSTFPSDRVKESEQEQNYYEILVLQGTAVKTVDYQIAAFDRYYSLNFNPDPIGDLIFNGIAPRVLHSGWLNGIQGDITYRASSANTLRTGLYVSGESIELDDRALTFPATDGAPTSTVPITVIDNHNNFVWLLGIYVEDKWRPIEGLTIHGGMRWDEMSALVTENQFSPRLSVEYSLTTSTVIHGGYARYFKTPPFESVALGTVTAFRNTTGAPSVPFGNDRVPAERDDYVTFGVRQKLRDLSIGVNGFGQLAHEQLDLAQFAGTPIVSPLSYRHSRAWGADLSLDYRSTSISAYLNFSYSVLQARDIVAGQFLADSIAEVSYIANHWVFLDDSQTFTGSSGVAYNRWGFLLAIDGFWGSGYRRGFANSGELPPILQFNVALEHGLKVPKLGHIAARITALNVFDYSYQIRNGTGIGVFSPQYGPRRALYGSVKIPLSR